MTNPKGDLIEYCRVQGLGTPSFETEASGPEHQPVFTCEVVIAGEVRATAQARTKRDAEKIAAAQALEALGSGTLALNMGVRVPAHTVADDMEDDLDQDDDEDGPWPIFPEVLSRCLEIADGRVDRGQMGAKAVDEVRRLSLELYKGVLEELGEYA